MTTIPPVLPIAPLQSATAQVLPPEARHQDLRPEQVVRATVAEGGKEHVLLQFGERTVRAETHLPLRTGQRLDLQVVSTSPRLEFRLLEDLLATRLSRSFHLLAGKWDLLPPIRDLLGGANPLFERLSPSARVGLEVWMAVQGFSYDRPDREFLRHLYRRFGLDLEARLARGEGKEGAETLKGALLELAGVLKDSDSGMAERIGRLLQSLELFQLCQARLAEGGVQFLPLPLPWLEQGYLLADQGGDGEVDDDHPFRLSLHLSLQGLGDLRIDVLQDANGLYLRFAGESPEKATFISSYQDELREALGPVLQGLSFSSGAENPTVALMKRVLPEGGRLDTRV